MNGTTNLGAVSCEDLRALLTVLSHKYRHQTAVLATLLKLLQLYDPGDGPALYLKWVEILSVLLEGLEAQLLCCLVSSLPLPAGADQAAVRLKARDIIGSPLLLPKGQENPRERRSQRLDAAAAEIRTSEYDLFIAEGASLDRDDQVDTVADVKATPWETLVPGERSMDPIPRQYFGAMKDHKKRHVGYEASSEAVSEVIDKMAGGEPFSMSILQAQTNDPKFERAIEHKFERIEEQTSFIGKKRPLKSSDSSDLYSSDTSLSIDVADSNSEGPAVDTKFEENPLITSFDNGSTVCEPSENSDALDRKQVYETIDHVEYNQLSTKKEHSSNSHLNNEFPQISPEVSLKVPVNEEPIDENVRDYAGAVQEETVTGTAPFEKKRRYSISPANSSEVKLPNLKYPPTCSTLKWTPKNVHNVFGFPIKKGKLFDLSSDDSDAENDHKHETIGSLVSISDINTAKAYPSPTINFENKNKAVSDTTTLASSIGKHTHENFNNDCKPESSSTSSPTVNTTGENIPVPVKLKGSECSSTSSTAHLGRKSVGITMQQQRDQCLPSTVSTPKDDRERSQTNIQDEIKNVNVSSATSEVHILKRESQMNFEQQDTSEQKHSIPMPDSVINKQEPVEKPRTSQWSQPCMPVSHPLHMYSSDMYNSHRTEWISTSIPVSIPTRMDSAGSSLQVHKAASVPSRSEPCHVSGETTGSLLKGQNCSVGYPVPYFVRTARGGMFRSYTTLAQASFNTQPTAVVRRPVPCVQQTGVPAMQQQERQAPLRAARRLQMLHVQPAGWGSVQQLRRVMTGPGGRGMVWTPSRQAVLVRRQRVTPQDNIQTQPHLNVRRHNLEDIVQVLRNKTC
ncbi:uncharacterized protein LOC134530584 [Bacillus rossius redtenbacheri]|uniref:uncharacterized protein LOC134530584 n=1 Tax=Bacillus rossius redtenbacheri TaxID=93214 RepID=UPI002FDD9A8E